mgnify:CR=1 FL=1
MDNEGELNVAPYAGAWIETTNFVLGFALFSPSLPTRERGLKPLEERSINSILRSLPTRERGLKQYIQRLDAHDVFVAPYAGAWIETNCF